MAKRKAANTQGGNVTRSKRAPVTRSAQREGGVEPAVIKLAEQLGSFLGRLRKKADGWRGNATMRQQATQIRDGAADLLEQVSKASASARKTVAKATPVKAAKALASPKRREREGEKSVKARSGGAVDAPGKRHRKPPPQELFDPRLGEPMGKQMGQKSLKRRGRG